MRVEIIFRFHGRAAPPDESVESMEWDVGKRVPKRGDLIERRDGKYEVTGVTHIHNPKTGMNRFTVDLIAAADQPD
jgi:hypothetical protein